jgi:hypothetical protein
MLFMVRFQGHEDGSWDSIQRFVVTPGLDYVGTEETQMMDGGNVLLDEKRNQLVGEAEFREKNVLKGFLVFKLVEVLVDWRRKSSRRSCKNVKTIFRLGEWCDLANFSGEQSLTTEDVSSSKSDWVIGGGATRERELGDSEFIKKQQK